MKYFRYPLCILLIVSLTACAPKKVIQSGRFQKPEGPAKVDPAEELFASAEKSYQEKAYPAATDGFQKYLSAFPNGSRTPDVLMHLGDIYLVTGKPAEALPYYQRLTDRYPGSSPAKQAELAILQSLFLIGDYQKTIASAKLYLRKNKTADAARPAYEILGDAYTRSAHPLEAAGAYARMLELSPKSEASKIHPKLKAALAALPPSDVSRVTSALESDAVKPDILLLAAQAYMESKRYTDASSVLTYLTQQFPKSEPASRAAEMLQKLKTLSDFHPYTVGCLLPLSGIYEPFGKKEMKGIELAQNQFLLHHPDIPLTILFQDTASDPQQTASAVKALADAGAAAIVGPVATVETAAAEAQKYGIPIITLTQKEQITQTGNFVFRNFITPDDQTDALVSFTVKTLGLTRFGILYPDEPYGQNFMALFKEKVESTGGAITAVQMYDPKQTDFRETLKLLGAGNAPAAENRMGQAPSDADASAQPFDALFIPDAPQKVAVIVPQLAYEHIKPMYLLGTNLWHSPKLIHTGGPAIQGSIFADGFFAGSSSEAVQQFVNAFQDAYKEAPGYIEAISYDSAMMMFQIVSNPDIRFRSAIAKELLRPEGFSGVTGNFYFNSDREALKKPYLLQIKGEDFVEITSP